MIKLIYYESLKLCKNKSFLLGCVIVLFLNMVLLFISEQIGEERYDDAYKKLTSEFMTMSMEERIKYVNEKYRQIEGVYTIDQVLLVESGGVSEYSKALRKSNVNVFKEFMVTYNLGRYLNYTDNLYDEYTFLSKIKEQLDTVNGYEDYLERLQSRAKSFSQISIFNNQDGDSYESKSIENQAKTYGKLNNVPIDYYPEEGILSALEFRLSDVLLIICVLLISSILIRDEKDYGLISLQYSLPKGRGKTALSKLITVWSALFILVFFLYGTNLVFYHSVYGLGDMFRSIQSLPSMIQCTWMVSVVEYVGLFLLAKWISAVIVGTLLMLCTYCARNVYVGWLYGIGFIGLNYLIRVLVSGIGRWNLFRYMNIFSFMNTNELLSSFIQVNVFGEPIRILWTECVGAIIYLILFTLIFLRVYNLGFAVFKVKKSSEVQWKNAKNKKREVSGASVLRHELYKLFKVNGGIVIAGAYLVYLVFSSIQEAPYVNVEERYYKEYYEQWGGRLTQETVDAIQEANKEFAPLYELEDALSVGALTYDEYEMAKQSYALLETKKMVFDSIIYEKIAYLENHEKAWLVYDTGYEVLFDIENEDDIFDMIVLYLTCILLFSNVFCFERTAGMTNVNHVTPLGRNYLYKVKNNLCKVSAVVLSIASLVPRYIYVGMYYGFDQFMAPAQSLEFYHSVPVWLTIYHMMFIQVIFRALCGVWAVNFILWLSQKLKSILGIYFVAVIVLELVAVMALCGFESLTWLTPWLEFHFCASSTLGIHWGFWAIHGFLLLLLYRIFSMKNYAWNTKKGG